MNDTDNFPLRFYSWSWMTAPRWQPVPIGFDKPARPTPLGGRKRDVGEVRPSGAARTKARDKRRARR